jgi:sugar/nucleoside kinase (ribokinase family)
MLAIMGATDERKPLICLGEGLVDLIDTGPCPGGRLPDRLEVRAGGALANVAVAARRAGAPVALASGCGADRWGRYLVDHLRAEGIDLRFYSEIEGIPTAYAFAFLDSDGEPTFEIRGEGIDASIASLAGREGEIVETAAAVAFGSNTLVTTRSREITAEVCRRAREAEVPLLFDPNLRPGRWDDLDRARECCLPFATAASVLKCNAAEARWLLGDADPPIEIAAEALHDLGPDLVVVTDGVAPAIARGAVAAAARPPSVEIVSPLGAGDAFMGTLAAGLLAAGFDLSRTADALQAAVEAAARTCTRLGACDR